MNKKGMTLIETIVAFAIISVIIVVALMSINTITSVNVKAQDMNMADEALEDMIAAGTGGTDSDKVTVTIGDPSNPATTFSFQGVFRTYETNGRSMTVFVLKSNG